MPAKAIRSGMATAMESHLTPEYLSFDEHGATLHRGAARPVLAALTAALAPVPSGQAGMRLTNFATVNRLVSPDGPIGRIASGLIGPAAMAVRAILFDKTADRNWALGWHRDRTICVRQRIDVHGFGPWTVKAGMIHVEPPFPIIEKMVTLRVHIDAVAADNAPLLIAPGSHRMGRIAVKDIARVVDRCGSIACHAEVGDIWAYSTPIVHASAASLVPARRRVLQIDYSSEVLPSGLVWQGI